MANAGYRGPEEPLSQGSVLSGILGAALGALLGALPLFFLTLYLSPAVREADAWNGFGLLSGYCACLGYRGFRGRRSTAVAWSVVGTFSTLAVVGSILIADAYSCCEQTAVFRLQSALALLSSWMWLRARLPALGIGLTAALAGILGAARYILWYTDPRKALRKYGGKVFETPKTRLTVPPKFIVRGESRFEGVLGALGAVIFGVLLVLSWAAFDAPGDRGWLLGTSVGCSLAVIASLYTILRRRNCRVEVDGECLRYVDALGRETDFYVGDIQGLGRSVLTGNYQFCDGEGRTLGWFSPELKNGKMLVQYLRERRIGTADQERNKTYV